MIAQRFGTVRALHDKPLVWPAALTDCTQM